MAKVTLENICKTFPAEGSRRASPDVKSDVRSSDAKTSRPTLNNISLTVEDGEFMVLVGPSGCGKSTLLRLISGLESLTSGSIWVGDRQIDTLPPKQRDIAMVFQSYALYPHLSVYDNLAFGLRRTRPSASKALLTDRPEDSSAAALTDRSAWEGALTSLTRKLPGFLSYRSAAEREIAQRVRTVAEMLQIEELLSRLPKQLSGGQKQRVALGRAMARSPQVFLMDEPLSNLDAKLRTETRAQIVGLQRQLQTTTLYVTHDQTEAMTMGDRIAVMNRGEIQQIAPPLELYRHPANRFVAAFIGSPPMNFLTVTVRANQLVHPAFTLALPPAWQSAIAPYQNRLLILGIRPEHFAIGQQPGSVPVTVTQLEALGSETFVFAQLPNSPTSGETVAEKPITVERSPAPHLANSPLLIRLSADQPVRAGSTLQVSLPADKIHLFDAATEMAIQPL